MCFEWFGKEENWKLDEDDYGANLSNMGMQGDVFRGKLYAEKGFRT